MVRKPWLGLAGIVLPLPALALATALLLAAARPAAAQELAGVYSVSGSETGKGAYSGTAELRWTGAAYTFVRTITYTAFTDAGFSVATAWEGTATAPGGSAPAGLIVTVPLRKMGWITAAGGLTRTPADAAPVTVTGAFSGTPLAGTFTGPGLAAAETWTYTAAPAPAPHFAQDITRVPMNDAPSSGVKAALFALYSSFHHLPAVAPHAAKPEFNAAIHSHVIDHTDFAFLRAHPDTIRVVGAVIDPINLLEARVRSDAFRHTLAAKAALVDAEAPGFVNALGILATTKTTATGALDGLGDGALWTACYLASQACRYQVTGAAEALANVEHCLDGLLLLADIRGVPGVFARAVKPADGPPTGDWVAGTGAYAGIHWLPRHNNDMLKGLMYGYLWAYEVLPAASPKREAIRARVRTMCAHSDLVRDGKMNEALWNRMAAVMTGEAVYHDRYRALMKKPVNLAWVLAGNGALGEPSIADWSGNHLNTVHQITINLLGGKSPSDPYAGLHKMGWRNGWLRLRRIRPALFSLAYAGLGGFTVKASDAPWFEDARWLLREMPAVRAEWPVNHSLRADWCMSPYPSLPWKGDWMTNEGRQQALYSYAHYMRPPSGYEWKDAPIRWRGGGAGDAVHNNGADYLHAYWLGRKLGTIAATD
ncbi:MAG: hypothetical protein HZA54_08620 [Planctomycetes bacterium]|nr:hypothetical protein [Planctomycetota bacterium]